MLVAREKEANERLYKRTDKKREIIKAGDERVVEWLWRLCNMAFESGVVSEDWASVVIAAL